MNPEKMRNGADRLRALNVQQRVEVVHDERGIPSIVKRTAGNEKGIESVGEIWRMDDEWGGMPDRRRDVEGNLEGGGRVVLVEDQLAREGVAPRAAEKWDAGRG